MSYVYRWQYAESGKSISIGDELSLCDTENLDQHRLPVKITCNASDSKVGHSVVATATVVATDLQDCFASSSHGQDRHNGKMTLNKGIN